MLTTPALGPILPHTYTIVLGKNLDDWVTLKFELVKCGTSKRLGERWFLHKHHRTLLIGIYRFSSATTNVSKSHDTKRTTADGPRRLLCPFKIKYSRKIESRHFVAV